MSSSPGKKPPRDREAIDLALDLRDALVAIHPDSAHLKQLEATNRESDLFEAELQLIRPGRFRGYQRQTNHRPFELPESRSGDLDRPVADASDDIDGAAEGLNVPADGVHLGDLAVLDLGDPRLGDAHQRSDLHLGKPGVLPQLRELIAALLGAHLRPAPLPLCDAAGTIPAGSKLPTYRLVSSQRTAPSSLLLLAVLSLVRRIASLRERDRFRVPPALGAPKLRASDG